jgi:flagellar FliL protein
MQKQRQMIVYGQAGLLIPLILTTVLAVAIGGGEGMMATKLGVAPGSSADAPKAEAPAPAKASESHEAKPEAAGEKGKDAHGEKGNEKGKPVQLTGTVVRDLPPIVTNIALPEDTWIRLESAIVFDAEKLKEPDVATKEITNDILTYLRTLSLPQIQGAQGLRHLREDLSERVAIRTDGKVKEFLIQGMVVQ